MLEDPPFLFLSFVVGIVICLVFGGIISSIDVWKAMFPKGTFELYLKVGEYGESEVYPKSWSPFQEPLNAWTSLAYAVVGIVILITGFADHYAPSDAKNHLTEYPAFSILYGITCIYLGVASCLFHASHSEVWRKADAGMTSGSVVTPAIFSIFDKLCPPSTSGGVMVFCAATLQISLTHGYLPYGSSDYLLGSLIAVCWSVELLGRYGGPVDTVEYVLWGQCVYVVVGGALCRLCDIKRADKQFFTWAWRALVFLTLVPFAYWIGLFNPVILVGLCACGLIYHDPSLGHVFWHFASAYALYEWWLILRTKPGNIDMSSTEGVGDTACWTVIFSVVMKNAIRRIFMALPFPSSEHRDRIFFLLEHLFFASWAYYVLAYLPAEYGVGSWLATPSLCWVEPSYPFEMFRLFYLVKVGAHVEDLMYLFVTNRGWCNNPPVKSVEKDNTADEEMAELIHKHEHLEHEKELEENKSQEKGKDVKMIVHHVVTAVLCIASWATGYSRIGSLVMLLHDVSDLPLDMLRISNILGWKAMQMVCMVCTLLTWAYWRLWYFPFVVIDTIAWESKSLIYESSCQPGHCSNAQMPERMPFIILLGTLAVLHYVWYWMMLKLIHKELKKDGTL